MNKNKNKKKLKEIIRLLMNKNKNIKKLEINIKKINIIT